MTVDFLSYKSLHNHICYRAHTYSAHLRNYQGLFSN